MKTSKIIIAYFNLKKEKNGVKSYTPETFGEKIKDLTLQFSYQSPSAYGQVLKSMEYKLLKT